MSENRITDKIDTPDWKTQTYMLGTLVGAGLGFLASYLFAKAADENPDTNGERPAIQTAQLLSLALAAIGIMRQISEMGKAGKKDK
ncbi:MAG: hypothetical protein OHK0046_01650 [Anaerolineae bacterium]